MSKSSRRVLVFARCTVQHPVHGGMETATARVIEGLLARGWEVGLVTTDGADVDALSRSVTKLWVLPGTRPGRYSLRWWLGTRNVGAWEGWRPHAILSVSVAGALVARLRADLPSLAVSHGTALGDLRSRALSFRRVIGRPYMAGEFARLVVQIPRLGRDWWCYRQFKQVFAVSEGVQIQLRSLLRPRMLEVVPASTSVDIVPNGLDPDEGTFNFGARTSTRQRLGFDQDDVVLLYLGRVDSEKGVFETIRSLLHLPRNHRLLVVGDGPASNPARRVAEESGLSDRIIFAGRVADVHVPALLSSADVLILATHRVEGLPMVVLEAMRSGLPIVATRRANVPRSTGRLKEVSPTPESIAKGILATVISCNRASALPLEYSMANVVKRFEAALS